MFKTRGYNAIYALWEGVGFPNNLQPSRTEPELTWDQFCSNLAAAKVDRLRVKMVGWNEPGAVSAPALSFEPVLGQFNDWGGRLQEAVEACKTHGIGLHVIPFDNQEWQAGWAAHAWNSANGGFLTDARAALQDPRAFQAARDRIDAILRYAGDVIVAWELVAEMTGMMRQDFWQTNWAGLEAVTMEIARPWVETMAQYVKSRHRAPVGNGQVAGDPSVPRNRVYDTPSLDFALVNWYGAANLGAQVQWLRDVQAVIQKPIYVEQYAPWPIGSDTSPEPADLSLSKAVEWAACCGEYGMVGPLRWPEIKPRDDVRQWWGVAHPNMIEIASVTAQMAEAVDLDDWAGRGENWNDRIAANETLVSSWGDGEHVTAFLQWNDSGGKVIEISGLAKGIYRVHSFDYLSGEETGSGEIETLLDTLVLRVTANDGAIALYIAPTVEQPPEPPPELEARVEALEARANRADAERALMAEQIDKLQVDVADLMLRIERAGNELKGEA